MERVLSYFPELTREQTDKFNALYDAYHFWNKKINVISRKDFENFYLHHVLHSLAIYKITSFTPGTAILDVGTGGGFPGVPLAIMHPKCHFVLMDSIKKKLKVIDEIGTQINLNNIDTVHQRIENYTGKFDFITSRAVTQFPKFVGWVRNNIKSSQQNAMKNGIFYLKGGDFNDEIKNFKDKIQLFHIQNFFTEDFFETKKVIYLPL